MSIIPRPKEIDPVKIHELQRIAKKTQPPIVQTPIVPLTNYGSTTFVELMLNARGEDLTRSGTERLSAPPIGMTPMPNLRDLLKGVTTKLKENEFTLSFGRNYRADINLLNSDLEELHAEIEVNKKTGKVLLRNLGRGKVSVHQKNMDLRYELEHDENLELKLNQEWSISLGQGKGILLQNSLDKKALLFYSRAQKEHEGMSVTRQEGGIPLVVHQGV